MPGHPSDTEFDFAAHLKQTADAIRGTQARNDANRDERMEAADRRQFVNRLKILRMAEADDLRKVGLDFDGSTWQRFSSNPAGFLIRADDVTAEAIFRLILQQETRR